jgi:hypothetical protein
MVMTTEIEHPYHAAFRGRFTSLLRWPDLDEFWRILKVQAEEGWYVYRVGEAPPSAALTADELRRFIDQLDRELRVAHAEAYCGIVYVDDRSNPAFVKIYDPDNLGSVCGSSERPPLPGWTISKLQPAALEAAEPPLTGRRRWWRSLTG